MKKIWKFLKYHVQEDFDLRIYISIGIFLVIILTFNFYFDFEDTYLEQMEGWEKFLSYILFYSFPYLTAVYIWSHFKRKKQIFHSKDFWLRSTLGLVILSLDSSMPFLNPLIDEFFHYDIQYWMYKVAINGISFLTVMLPLLLFYYYSDRHEKHVFGLSARQFDTKPYFLMLAIMLPIIIMASFNERFLYQYPMYDSSNAHKYLGVNEWVTVVIYEIAYGFDFVTVELLFRGFLVIGMMHLLGRGSVITMAVVYCVLHFGKPAGEAVSSIFGGYILGVIAYETKSIWGGIIVHMGIAWMMEIVAFVQKLLRDSDF